MLKAAFHRPAAGHCYNTVPRLDRFWTSISCAADAARLFGHSAQLERTYTGTTRLSWKVRQTEARDACSGHPSTLSWRTAVPRFLAIQYQLPVSESGTPA